MNAMCGGFQFANDRRSARSVSPQKGTKKGTFYFSYIVECPLLKSPGGGRVLELRENQYAVKVGGPPLAGKFTEAQLNAVFTTEGTTTQDVQRPKSVFNAPSI